MIIEGADKMNANQRPGFWRRLWRALWVTVLVLVILAAVGVGGYFGSRELLRAYSNIQARMDAQEQTIALMRSDVNALMGDDPEQLQQSASMGADISRLDIQVTNLESALNSELAQQQADLDDLTTGLETAVSSADALAADLATLNSALTALQGDINANGSRIDALGGEIDGLRANVDTLDGSVVALNEQQTAMLAETDAAPDVQRTLSLFRVWELITRARLRLLENNVGLAGDDIETAIRTVDLLVTLEPDSEPLQMVQARLVLAFGNLPDAPDLAVTDLETAWDELDGIFENELLVGAETAVTVEDAAVEAATETPPATDETPTPAATSAPEETPTPTPTP